MHADILELGGDGLGERAGRGGAGRAKLLGHAVPALLPGGDGLLGRLERVDASFEGLQLRAGGRG